MDEGTVLMERLSLKELCEGNLVGGLHYWGPWKIFKKALETGIPLHRGPAGDPDRGLVYRGR